MLARGAIAAGLSLFAGLIAWTACTDYDDGEPPADASVDASADAKASRSSDGGASSSGGDCADVCDCDQDGFKNSSCVDASDDAGQSLVDCDDHDPLRHPQAELSGHLATGQQTGDWNCDGVVERSPTVVQLCTNSPVGCVSPTLSDGFEKELPCGATGDLVRCTKVDNECKLAPTGEKAVEQCR